MHRGQTGITLIVGLILSIVCGCWQGAMTGTPGELAGRSLLPQMPVMLAVESLLLTCPSKENADYEAIWHSARPAGLPESNALWCENGLRLGVLRSPLPARLQQWLEDEGTIPSGSLQTFHQRHETFLATTPVLERYRLRWTADLAAAAMEKEWAQIIGGIWVQPRLHKRSTLLICEPRLQHAEQQSWIRPAADASRFVRSEEPLMERFPTLQVEVELTPEEYLIIGPLANANDNLGFLLFRTAAPTTRSATAMEPAVATWRLLLLRVHLPASSAGQDLPEISSPYLRR